MARINISFELSQEQEDAFNNQKEIADAIDALVRVCGYGPVWRNEEITSAYFALKDALMHRQRECESYLIDSFGDNMRDWATDFEVIS